MASLLGEDVGLFTQLHIRQAWLCKSLRLSLALLMAQHPDKTRQMLGKEPIKSNFTVFMWPVPMSAFENDTIYHCHYSIQPAGTHILAIETIPQVSLTEE